MYEYQSKFANINDVINEKIFIVEKLLELSLNHITKGKEYNDLFKRAHELTRIITNHCLQSQKLEDLHSLFKYYKERYESVSILQLPWDSVQECSICFEIIEKGSGGCIECGHAFHNECLQRWMEVKHNCPNCRKSENLSRYLS